MRSATPHVLFSAGDPLLKGETIAFGGTGHCKSCWVERPVHERSDVHPDGPRQQRRHRVPNLPGLLKARLFVRPVEIVGEGLQPRTLADSENPVEAVVNWAERREVPRARPKRITRSIGMQSVVPGL